MALDTTIRGDYTGKNFEQTEVSQQYTHITTAPVQTIVAAQAGKQIQITRIVLCSDTAGTFTLWSDTDPIMPLIIVANAGYKEQAPDVRNPLFVTTVGATFRISVSVVPTHAYLYIQYRYV